MTFQSRTPETRDDWQTPLIIMQELGRFDLDPCANINDPKRCADAGYTIDDDGLSKDWYGRVWVNPPYGSEAKLWMAKLARHGNGIALIPPRMGAAWFHDIVLCNVDAVFFLKGRLSFISAATGKAVGGNNADSALFAFGRENVEVLKKSGLTGKLWVLNSG